MRRTQVIVDAINRVDLDLRKNLFSNVILSGGSTLYQGACYASANLCYSPALPVLSYALHIFYHRRPAPTGYGARLLNEVKKLALKDIKIKIYAPPERKYSTWIGGSILAGLNTFKKVRQNWLVVLKRMMLKRVTRCVVFAGIVSLDRCA